MRRAALVALFAAGCAGQSATTLTLDVARAICAVVTVLPGRPSPVAVRVSSGGVRPVYADGGP